MSIATLPRIRLAELPTPLEELPRLSQALGGPRILFKRDDFTGLGLGGNKVRKLEFLLADAKKKGAEVIVSGAGPQSNHLRLVAAACKKLGLDVVLVMHGSEPEVRQGNFLLDQILDAKIIFTGSSDRSEVDLRINEVAEQLIKGGRRAYAIPRGGASPIGSLGYVHFVSELQSQLDQLKIRANHLICAVGSCGTLAGIRAGVMLSPVSYELCGITVSRPKAECKARIESLGDQIVHLLGHEGVTTATGVGWEVHDGYIGPGYGIPDERTWDAIRLLARTEGIFLDPVYTGKAAAGMIDLIRRGQFKSSDTLIFLHTGGSPAIFAHADKFTS